MKKRGFGAGNWNGAGGKTREGEDVLDAAIREVQEEVGVRLKKQNIREAGYIDFSNEQDPSWEQRVYVYLADAWEGEPAESEEMKPQWFKMSELPFSQMWPDDPYWLPKVLNGEKIKANFQFANKTTINKYIVNTASV